MKSGLRALIVRHGAQSIAVIEHDRLHDGESDACIRTGKARWQ
jgi:hypothetical protein